VSLFVARVMFRWCRFTCGPSCKHWPRQNRTGPLPSYHERSSIWKFTADPRNTIGMPTSWHWSLV